MAVEVKRGERFDAGVPKPLFDTHIVSGSGVRFDVSPDGRFLIPVQTEQATGTPLTLVINWNAAMRN